MNILLSKCYDTLKPLWDFRFLLICSICLGIGFMVDHDATRGMLLFCLFVPVCWSAALTIAKILRPGTHSGELRDKAKETPMGASIVYAADRCMIIAIGLSFVLWWVRP